MIELVLIIESWSNTRLIVVETTLRHSVYIYPNRTLRSNIQWYYRESSQVLIYDWTEPGEVESVVEDIEELNFDQWGQYELQQKDWRFVLEEAAAQL